MLYVAYDSPSYGLPKGEPYPSKEAYMQQMWTGHAVVISGPYDDIFTLSKDFQIPRQISILGIAGSGMLYVPRRDTVVRRRLRDGRTIVLQQSEYDDRIDAYLLSNHPGMHTDELSRNVCDLNNPRLGLQDKFRGRLLVGDKDEILPDFRYVMEDSLVGSLIYRGKDPFTRLPVYCAPAPAEWISLELNSSTMPEVQAVRKQAVKKTGSESRWNKETLSHNEQQIRLWLEEIPFGKLMLHRRFALLRPTDTIGNEFSPEEEKARFDERGNWLGPRLQVTYLY